MCTQQMSAPPPVARRHSGIRVMITPGEQPRPSGVPIYTNLAKGTLTSMKYTHILTFSHIDITSVSSLFLHIKMLILLDAFSFLCPENGASGEPDYTSAQREVVCTCINSLDNLLCDQSLQEMKVLMSADLSKT